MVVAGCMVQVAWCMVLGFNSPFEGGRGMFLGVGREGRAGPAGLAGPGGA